MIRYLAALAAACLGLVLLAASAEAQAPPAGESLFGAFRPYLVELAGVFIAALSAWLFKLIQNHLTESRLTKGSSETMTA